MQVHNLLDAATHLPVLREWKAQGRIRYLGITHYASSAHPDVEALLRREPLDFLQINDSPVEPEAGERLLPLAAGRGVAVIANRPFGGGEPLRRAARKPLPSRRAGARVYVLAPA
ncbi:MAG: aldo/keto reductase, partial [Thermoanaerobaculia bacterium]